MSSEPLNNNNQTESHDILSLLCDTTASGHYYPKECIQLITRNFRKTNPHVIQAFNFHRNQFWVYFFANVNHSQQKSTMDEIEGLILTYLSTQNNSVSIEELNKVLHAVPSLAESNNDIVLH